MPGFPSNSDYTMIAQNLHIWIKDEYIKTGKVIIAPIGNRKRIVSYAGAFSKVFPICIGNKKIALRFWTKEIKDSENRYKEIDIYLKQKMLPYFTSFNYINNGLNWSQKEYPFIYMDWLHGVTLREYINNNISNASIIKRLAIKFLKMVKTLHKNNIAHGDLHDDNIFVIENSGDIELKLIDYDSLYVPKLEGLSLDIEGVRAYQHPKKNSIKKINKKIDYFSELVIYLSLLVYVENNSLWNPKAEKQLLFNEKDFAKPLDSKILKELKSEKYSKNINILAVKLTKFCCENNILELSPLESIIPPTFDDKDIEEAYQEFILSAEEDQYLVDELRKILEDKKEKNTKYVVLKYLHFLANLDKYVLPLDFEKILNNDKLYFIRNIYFLYTIDELEKLGRKFKVNNFTTLARKGTFEQQKNIQELYFLNTRYIPIDFVEELMCNFFDALKKIKSYIRKDILEQILKKSELSDEDVKLSIETLQKSKVVNYHTNLTNIKQLIVNQYILPKDYKKFGFNKMPAANCIIESFYSIREIRAIEKKISSSNIVSAMSECSLEEQRNIEKLFDLPNKYIPIDFSKYIDRNFLKALNETDFYIKKDGFNRTLCTLKISKDKQDEYKKIIKNCSATNYLKKMKEIKDDILMPYQYPKSIQKYFNNLSIDDLDNNDLEIIFFLKKSIKEFNRIQLFYAFFTISLVVSYFLTSNGWILGIISFISTTIFILNMNRKNNSFKKIAKERNKQFLKNKIFPQKLQSNGGIIVILNILFIITILIFFFSVG